MHFQSWISFSSFGNGKVCKKEIIRPMTTSWVVRLTLSPHKMSWMQFQTINLNFPNCSEWRHQEIKTICNCASGKIEHNTLKWFINSNCNSWHTQTHTHTYYTYQKLIPCVGGGRSLDTNAYVRAKVWKCPFFENGRFSEHLIFDNFFFFCRKEFVYPDKHVQELCFFEKKIFFFLENFFRKKFWKNLQTFSAHKQFVKFFLNFFEKKCLPKKHFFSKKKEKINVFFQKNRVLFYRGKKFFLQKNIFFVK